MDTSITTFYECIKHQRVIDVDLQPSRDLLWSGICVKDNGQIAVFINLDNKRKCLDGFTVFRSKEISGFRLCDKTEYRDVTQTSVADYYRRLNLQAMVDVPSSLLAVASRRLIAFFTGNDTKSYYVGKLVSLRKDLARFRLIDKKAKFTRYKAIRVQNINFFSFSCAYEEQLARQLKKNGRTIA